MEHKETLPKLVPNPKMEIQNLNCDNQKMSTLEVCIKQAWLLVNLTCDGCTGPDYPELQHNTLYFSLPTTKLLWLPSLLQAEQNFMPVQGSKVYNCRK